MLRCNPLWGVLFLELAFKKFNISKIKPIQDIASDKLIDFHVNCKDISQSHGFLSENDMPQCYQNRQMINQ